MYTRVLHRAWVCGICVLAGTGLALAETTVAAPAAASAIAATDLSVPLAFGLPDLKVRTLLVMLHLVGLCFGLGGVFVLDILLAKAVLRGRFHLRNTNVVWILSNTTMAGLALLWASGIGFLMVYAHDHPELLANPKIIAKVAIVSVLTINGFVIHVYCLPKFMQDLSVPPLISLDPVTQITMLFSGVLSGVSWYTAGFIGAAKELNTVVPAERLLVLWAVLVLLTFAATFAAFTVWAARRRPDVDAARSTGDQITSIRSRLQNS